MNRVGLLDHGYLETVESWGSDERIIEAARMSTGKGFLGWGPKAWRCNNCGVEQPWVDLISVCEGCGAGRHTWSNTKGFTRVDGDEKLLRYLYENRHHTPFEMAGLTIEAQAPIFVFREWHRHRVPFSYNEASARYAPLPDLNYIPTLDRLMIKPAASKQTAGTGEALTESNAQRFRAQLSKMYAEDEELYQNALTAGVPKELARIHLPVGRYSKMRASANLRGWLNFLTLRAAPAAQYEIRVYAEALGRTLSGLFPRTMALFEEGRK
jgi:thymidylate synthase (FAD)